MGWTVPGPVCRAVGMASAGRRACLYRLAHPLPLGAGEYVRPAVIGSACGEGVGVSSRFSLSRCSSSCHLVAPAVIASLCLLRRPVLVVPCSHRSRLPCPMCFVPCPVALSSCPLVVIPVFSCGFLSSFSPFLRLAGRGVLCLLASFVAVLVPFALLSLRLVPLRLLACPPGAFSLRSPRRLSLIVSCCYSVPPLVLFMSYRSLCSFVCPPRISTSVGGGAWRLVLAVLAIVPIVRAAACGRWDSVGGDGLLLGGSVSAAGCVRFVVSVFVYINWALARVS